MKKLFLLGVLIISLIGCTDEISPEKFLENQLNPYREYRMNDTTVAAKVESGILETEAINIGLNTKTSSAHMISYKKLGEYGTGEIRILGEFTPEGLKNINANRSYGVKEVTNTIINYTCKFEYSYKTKRYTWISDLPYYKQN